MFRALRFVVIVWLIAGCFLVVQRLPAKMLYLAVQKGWIPDSLVLPPSTVNEQAAETGHGREASGSRSAPMNARDALAVAWQLGVTLGRVSVIAQLSEGKAVALLQQFEQKMQLMATALGVPVPHRPEIRYSAMALSEFPKGLDSDPQQTGAQLAARYSDRHRLVYKLGALCGYDEFVISQIGESVFTAHIRYHARRAGIPDELWQPLITPTPGGDTGAESSIRLRQLDRVSEFLRTDQ